VKTTDGEQIRESRDMLWPQLPVETRIAELIYLPRRGMAMGVRDCEAYGFQRFRIDVPGGVVGNGAQIIGIKGKDAIIVEFNEVNGETSRRAVPRSELTYAQGLLRHGRG
jgi:hypothetical protein